MHRRKRWLVYPLDYSPGDGYTQHTSRGAAIKKAQRQGGGSIDVVVHVHPSKGAMWTSSAQHHMLELTPTDELC